MQDTDDWDPVTQIYPSQPEWDNHSVMESPRAGNAGHPGQWSQETLAVGNDNFLSVPRIVTDGQRNSVDSSNEPDYFSHSRGSTADTPQGYNGFLERANRTIAKDQRQVPDPFLDGAPAPNKPFGGHSRVSSVESISSIVDEKSNSPLNKAIASVSIISIASGRCLLKPCSLLMLTVVWPRCLSKNYKCSMPRTQKGSYLSSDSWSRARKPSLVKFVRTNYRAQQASGRKEIRCGVHLLRHSTRGRIVRAKAFR